MLSNSSVYIIGLCFGDQHVNGMLEVADQFCERNFPGLQVFRLVVDNSLCSEVESVASNIYRISGNNQNMEFSGWQRGIDFIEKKYGPSSKDVFVLVNDTVHRRNYAIGGDRYFDDFMIRKSTTEWPDRWAAGYLDDFPAEVSINGLTFTNWIRSNFIVFNQGCTNLITPLVFPCSESVLFEDDVSKGFWRDSAPLSENWKAYISSWLFGDEDPNFPEYRLKWIKCQRLSDNNRDYFRKKAVSILSEHYFSARLWRGGVEVFDFNTFPKLSDRHLTPYYK